MPTVFDNPSTKHQPISLFKLLPVDLHPRFSPAASPAFAETAPSRSKNFTVLRPVFVDLLTIGNRGSLVQASALLMRRPGGLNEADRVSFK
jgi:hypothetical protein